MSNIETSKKATNWNSNWLLSRMVKLSFLSEGLAIKHVVLVTFFIMVQSLYQCIMPITIIIPLLDSTSSTFQKVLQKFVFYGISQLQQSLIMLTLIHAIIFVGIIFLMMTIFLGKSDKMLKKGLYALSVFYSFSPVMIIFHSRSSVILSGLFYQSSPSNFDKISTSVCIMLSFTSFLLTLFLCFVYKMTFHTNSINSPNFLCVKFSYLQIFLSFSSKLLCFSYAYAIDLNYFGRDTEIEQQATVGVLTFLFLSLQLISLLKLHIQVKTFTFLNEFISKVYQCFLIIQFSIVLVGIIGAISSTDLIYDNTYYIIITLWLFAFITLHNYKTKQEYESQLLNKQEIDTQIKAQIYIMKINQIVQSTNNHQQSLILTNLIKAHTGSCEKVQCYCKQINLKMPQQKLQYQKRLIIQIMDHLISKYKDNFNLLLLVAYIKLKVHRKFIDSSQKIKSMLCEHKPSFEQKFMAEKYILSLSQFLNDKKTLYDVANTQKCTQSEMFLQKFMEIINRFIILKVIFWRHFSKGVVSAKIFEQNIDEQLKMMKKFNKETLTCLQNFGNSYLLVSLLVAYEKFILLKDKISSHVSDQVILLKTRNCKGQLFRKQKNQKQSVQKAIFSNRACTIQISMNPQKLGTVVIASKNVQQVFGYKPQIIQGFNINRIMPVQMQFQHDHLLKNWSQTCSWTNIGKIRNIFCIDKNNVCFLTGIYLKPVLRMDCVNVVGGVFKQNEKDYLVVDNCGNIVGAGQNFITLLGDIIIGIPLSLICADANHINEWATAPQKLKYKSSFYSLKNCDNLIQRYKQESYNLQKNQKLLEEILDSVRSRQANTANQNFLEFQVYPYQIGRVLFIVIKIQNLLCDGLFKKVISNSFEDNPNTTILQNQRSSINFKQSEQGFLAGNQSVSSTASSSIQTSQSNLTFFQMMFYQTMSIKDTKITKVVLVIFLLCVCAISIAVAKIFVNSSGFQQLVQITKGNKVCADTIQLSMLCYNRGVSINNFVDDLIDDPTNTTITSEISMEIQGSDLQTQNLKDLVVNGIVNLNSETTSLTKMQIYGYQKKYVNWVLQNDTSIRIYSVNLFMNYFYLIKNVKDYEQQIEQAIQNNSTSTVISKIRDELNKTMILMKQNFGAFSDLSSEFLSLFSSSYSSTIKYMKSMTYIKISINGVCFIAMMLVLHNYYLFRQNQKTGIFNQYKNIPILFVTNVSNYFINLQSCVQNHAPSVQKHNSQGKIQTSYSLNSIQQKLKDFQMIYEQTDIDAVCSAFYSHSKSKLSISYKKTIHKQIIYVVAMLVLVILNIRMLTLQIQISEISSKVMKQNQDLITSQNLLISSYFQFKQYHSNLAVNTTYDKTYAKNLLKKINFTDVKFRQVISSTISQFKTFDTTYAKNITKIVTTNVCNLTRSTLTQSLYQQCLNQTQNSLLLHGSVVSFNYFQRAFQQILHQFIYTDNMLNKTADQIRSMTTLRRVDKMLLYLFRVFQKTEKQILVALKNTLNGRRATIFWEHVAIQLFILALFIGFLFYFYHCEQNQTSNRIGRIFLLPIKLLRYNKKIIRNFEDIIDYHNIK